MCSRNHKPYPKTRSKIEHIPRPVLCLERKVEETLYFRDYLTSFEPDELVLDHFRDVRLTKTVRGLCFNSQVFLTSHEPGLLGELDNYKMLAFYNKIIELGGEETIFETTMSAAQMFTDFEAPVPREYMGRIRNIHTDYRLCCAGPLVRDRDNGLDFGFLLTNDSIYIIYDRRSLVAGSAAFCCVAPVKRRGPGALGASDALDDTYKLGIGIDRRLGVITWYIDGHPVYRVDRIGYRLDEQFQVLERGGRDFLVSVKSVQFGFGHFTFLDHCLPGRVRAETEAETGVTAFRANTALCMLSLPERYREVIPDSYGVMGPIKPQITFAYSGGQAKYRLFGQGVISMVKSINIKINHRSIEPYLEPKIEKPKVKKVKVSETVSDLEETDDLETIDSSLI